MKRSISQLLNFRIAIVLICVNLLIGVVSYVVSVHIGEEEFKKSINLYAKHLGDTFTQQLWLFDLSSAEQLADLSMGTSDVRGLRLTDNENKVVVERGYIDEISAYSLRRELRYEGKTAVGALELVFTDTSLKDKSKHALLTSLSMVGVSIVLTFLLVNFLLRRHLSKPLQKLQMDIHAVADGHFTTSKLLAETQEIHSIINVFNSMASSLAQREEQREQAEEAIHESHAILQAAMDCSPAGIAIADAPGGKLRYVNDAGLLIRGEDRETIVNGIGVDQYVAKRKLFDLDGNPLAMDDVPLARSIMYGEENSRDFIVRDVDGSDHIVSANAAPIKNKKEEIVAGIVVFTDITDRKKAEDQRRELEVQLHQKHKMEAVGYMAGGMAHNFNNNLSIILGNIELSQMKQAPGNEVMLLLENAKIAVRRSRDLVKKIITYSRTGIQNPVPIQLITIIDETIDLVSSTLPSTVTLKKDLAPDCKDNLISADASQIQEVLINLCNNAVQAMDEKGELIISLQIVELEQKNIPTQYDCPPGLYAKLSVQDNGCGMPAEMLDKIFDPFFSTKEEYEGAGLGLSTVQGVVAQHKGVVKVNSVLGQGAVFDLYFPIVGQGSSGEPIVEHTNTPGGTEKILFVDDEEDVATLGRRLLSTLGYQVSMMTDSSEALKLFTANADSFDLVITDQTMPKLTGKDLIAEIKKVRADIPTIIFTGFSSKIDDDEAKALGIHAFLMKPLELTTLAKTIRDVLDNKYR